jgi:hypothetical protein
MNKRIKRNENNKELIRKNKRIIKNKYKINNK